MPGIEALRLDIDDDLKYSSHSFCKFWDALPIFGTGEATHFKFYAQIQR